jgi:DNA-binding MarR family transcriptional regulator
MNATPRWLTSEQKAAWESFIHMQEKLIGRLSRRLQADSGLSASDYVVLVKLTETGGRTRVMDLAKLVEWEKSRMSHQVRRMTKRGLVTKEECPDDGSVHRRHRDRLQGDRGRRAHARRARPPTVHRRPHL